jgi:hypothetical protein
VAGGAVEIVRALASGSLIVGSSMVPALIGAAGTEKLFRSPCSPHRGCEVPNSACSVRFEMDLRPGIPQERLNNFPDTPGHPPARRGDEEGEQSQAHQSGAVSEGKHGCFDKLSTNGKRGCLSSAFAPSLSKGSSFQTDATTPLRLFGSLPPPLPGASSSGGVAGVSRRCLGAPEGSAAAGPFQIARCPRSSALPYAVRRARERNAL